MQIANALLFITLALVALPGFSAASEADMHFAKGKLLVDKNCGECVDSRRQGLEEGIAELELADSQGYANKVAIYKLMFQAYNDIGFYFTESGTEEMKKYLSLRQHIAKKLAAQLPDDAGILYQYARGVQDSGEQLEMMQKVLRLDPKNTDARLTVGLRLVEARQVDQGVAQLKQAVNDADPEVKESYRRRIFETLSQQGYKAQANQWRPMVFLPQDQQPFRPY